MVSGIVTSDAPRAKIGNRLVSARAQVGGASVLSPSVSFAGYGYPIGLLLALTYTQAQNTVEVLATERSRAHIGRAGMSRVMIVSIVPHG